jgi:hypothetical protein
MSADPRDAVEYRGFAIQVLETKAGTWSATVTKPGGRSMFFNGYPSASWSTKECDHKAKAVADARSAIDSRALR